MSELWARTHVGGEGVVIVSEMPNGRTSLLQRLARKFKLSGRKTLLIDLLRLPINASASEIWSKIHRRTGINFVEDTLVPREPAGERPGRRPTLCGRQPPGPPHTRSAA